MGELGGSAGAIVLIVLRVVTRASNPITGGGGRALPVNEMGIAQ